MKLGRDLFIGFIKEKSQLKTFTFSDHFISYMKQLRIKLVKWKRRYSSLLQKKKLNVFTFSFFGQGGVYFLSSISEKEFHPNKSGREREKNPSSGKWGKCYLRKMVKVNVTGVLWMSCT